MRRWRATTRLYIALVCVGMPATASAHPLDELVQSSFVTVHRDSIFLELDLIAGTRVSAAFFGVLDRDRNGQIDRGERRAYLAALSAALHVTIAGQSVALTNDADLWPTDAQLRGGEGMIRVFWKASMPRVADGDSLEFTLLNTHAPVTSGYLVNALIDGRTLPIARIQRSWTQQEFTLTVVATPPRDAPATHADVAPGRLHVFPAFIRHGIYHVATGFDHVLFVIALLLAGGRWQRILGIVTSFTLAHSVTLSLAVLGIIVPPSRPIEAAIAASIVIVGWQAFRAQQQAATPDVRLPMAFGFGLLHGFGFASAMQTLALPNGQLPFALAGFNIGVELAQLAIVLTIWPLLSLARRHAPARVSANLIRTCTAVVITMGSYWFVERVLAA